MGGRREGQREGGDGVEREREARSKKEEDDEYKGPRSLEKGGGEVSRSGGEGRVDMIKVDVESNKQETNREYVKGAIESPSVSGVEGRGGRGGRGTEDAGGGGGAAPSGECLQSMFARLVGNGERF